MKTTDGDANGAPDKTAQGPLERVVLCKKLNESQEMVPVGRVMAIPHPCATRMLPVAAHPSGGHIQAMEGAKPEQCRVPSIAQHPRECPLPGKLGC